jgi:hypothetical protein
MRRSLPLRLRGAVLGAALAWSPAFAQFGQNKIAYDRFDWKVYASPHFDLHYYGETDRFLDDIVSYTESAYLRISKELDHELRYRVPIILYQPHHGGHQERQSAVHQSPPSSPASGQTPSPSAAPSIRRL